MSASVKPATVSAKSMDTGMGDVAVGFPAEVVITGVGLLPS